MTAACTVAGCGRKQEARGYCHSHFERHRQGKPVGGPFPETPLDRLAEKIEVDGDCWIFTGATDGDGRYGALYNGATQKVERAHRRAYELLVGTIPAGLVLDHLCRRTLCVNPDHLDVVTQRENILRGGWGSATNARKTHCNRGHEFDVDNTIVRPSGRQCRECTRANARTYQRRRRAAARSEVAA